MTSSRCKPQHKLELFCLSYPFCEMGTIHILKAFVGGFTQCSAVNGKCLTEFLEHRVDSVMLTLLVAMAMDKCCQPILANWKPIRNLFTWSETMLTSPSVEHPEEESVAIRI